MLSEPGGDRIDEVREAAIVSAVNFSEIIAKLQERGVSDDDADLVIGEVALTVIAFDDAMALAAGRLRGATRASGLSFGDRACIALGQHLQATILTADRAWASLDLGVKIELIR